MALKNMYRLWSHVLSFFPSRKDRNIHESWKKCIQEGVNTSLPIPLVEKLALTLMLFHSLLTSHQVSRDPSVSIPAHPPLPPPAPRRHFPALPLTFRTGCSDSVSPPPRTRPDQQSLTTQPRSHPETHCPHLLAQFPLPLPALSPAWVVSVRS